MFQHEPIRVPSREFREFTGFAADHADRSGVVTLDEHIIEACMNSRDAYFFGNCMSREEIEPLTRELLHILQRELEKTPAGDRTEWLNEWALDFDPFTLTREEGTTIFLRADGHNNRDFTDREDNLAKQLGYSIYWMLYNFGHDSMASNSVHSGLRRVIDPFKHDQEQRRVILTQTFKVVCNIIRPRYAKAAA